MEMILFELLLTLPALFIIMLVAGVCALVFKQKKCLKWGVGVYLVLLLCLSGAHVYDAFESPESKLKRMLPKGMPAGVSNIEAESFTNTIDPSYYYTFRVSPEAFVLLKSQREFEVYEEALGGRRTSDPHFPEEWRIRYKNSEFDCYRFINEDDTFYYLWYSAKEQRVIYAVITT